MKPNLEKYRPAVRKLGLDRNSEDKALSALWEAVVLLVDRALTSGYPQVSAEQSQSEDPQSHPNQLDLTQTFNDKEDAP